jgi:hypothetical protein
MSGGMATDLRGFIYPLASVQHRYQWQLDILQGKLAAIQVELLAEQERLDELKQQMAVQAAHISKALQQRMNPLVHQRSIAYLVQCNGQIQEQEQRLALLIEQRQEIRQECIKQQQRLELTEQHRLRCLAEYVAVEQVRQSNEADRDWIARSVWKERMNAPQTHAMPKLEGTA